MRRIGCRPGAELEVPSATLGPSGGQQVLPCPSAGRGLPSWDAVPEPGRGQRRPGTQQPELDGTSVFAWIRGREAGGSV